MRAQEVAEAKRALRKAMGTARAGLQADHGAEARERLRDGGLDFLDRSAPGTVSGFHPYGSEIDCTGLLERLSDEGWVTALPVVVGPVRPLEFRPWRPGEPLEAGAWSIPVPGDAAGAVVPDVLLVPLLAFDRRGYRLGYGGGFYDRTLDQLRAENTVVAVGVAFAGQEVDAVPHDTQDQPLDWMLTQAGPFRCNRNTS
ncbi:MAG: 5-formyltetrahydrofolate cyclo-ligase [Hyphomicrobiales bacterium]